MRIIFVRHGRPNYAIDRLTDLGHLQAEAAADRLESEKIDRFFSSTCGRAVETAEHIAKRRNMEVTSFDFMREIHWGSFDGEPIPFKGHPWDVSEDMAANGQSILSPNWENEPPFDTNRVLLDFKSVREGFDRFLSELGYEREGDFYRITKQNDETILLASHAGSSTVVLSHIFNIPAPFLFTCIRPNFTAITVVSFQGEEGALISPRFEIANDSRHIEGISVDNVFGK